MSRNSAEFPMRPSGSPPKYFARSSVSACRFVIAAASSSGFTSLRWRPSNSFGRSKGVLVSYLFEYWPCKSGSPHGVRGVFHELWAIVTEEPTTSAHRARPIVVRIVIVLRDTGIVRRGRLQAAQHRRGRL